jgi:hypothetical protein
MKSLALLGLLALALPDGDRSKPLEGRDLTRFLFFAMLEGLVADGVPDQTVERVLERTEEGDYVNFVYACDICTPTIEALTAYAKRGDFYYSRKGDALVGESTLPAELRGLLDHADAAKRREGIEKLVNRYVERRFKELRYTEAEAQPVRNALVVAKKRGGVMRPAIQADLKECPSCKGAAIGSLLR